MQAELVRKMLGRVESMSDVNHELSVTPICPILWLPQEHLVALGHVQTWCIERFLLG